MDEFINEISQLLNLLSHKAKVLFAALTSERLYPHYVIFEERNNWGDSQLLQEALSVIYQYLIDENLITDEEIKDITTRIELVTPDTEDFDGIVTSFALDACTSLCSTLDFIISRNDDDILDVATYSRDTVYAFVQEKEQFSTLDPSGDIQTEHDDFMVREKQRQRALLDKLMKADLKTITDGLIDGLRDKRPIIDLSLLSE